METLNGELRLSAENCLVGDWISAQTVPDWDWKDGVSGHEVKIDAGCTMVFELSPYIGGKRLIVWKRTA